jgi:hypothetical protein
VRTQFKALPINDLVIARMSALHSADEGVIAVPSIAAEVPTPVESNLEPHVEHQRAPPQPQIVAVADLQDPLADMPPLRDDDDDSDEEAAKVTDHQLEEMLEALDAEAEDT